MHNVQHNINKISLKYFMLLAWRTSLLKKSKFSAVNNQIFEYISFVDKCFLAWKISGLETPTIFKSFSFYLTFLGL
jgi:hypothetical protein